MTIWLVRISVGASPCPKLGTPSRGQPEHHQPLSTVLMLTDAAPFCTAAAAKACTFLVNTQFRLLMALNAHCPYCYARMTKGTTHVCSNPAAVLG